VLAKWPWVSFWQGVAGVGTLAAAGAAWRAAVASHKAALESRSLRRIERLEHIFELLGELQHSGAGLTRRRLQAALVGRELTMPRCHKIAEGDSTEQGYADAYQEVRFALKGEQDRLPKG